MAKGAKMNNDSLLTTIQSCLMGFISWILLHLPEIQAFITFSLTVVFLVYKIREARARAKQVEKESGE